MKRCHPSHTHTLSLSLGVCKDRRGQKKNKKKKNQRTAGRRKMPNKLHQHRALLTPPDVRPTFFIPCGCLSPVIIRFFFLCFSSTSYPIHLHILNLIYIKQHERNHSRSSWYVYILALVTTTRLGWPEIVAVEIPET